jgi:hypothetical protein
VFTGAAGGAALTVWVGSELAWFEPPALVAVTTTSIVWATSAVCSV